MANPLLKLKRGSGAPASLQAGEPAYDLTNEVLYIGDGTNLDKIGGKGAAVMLEGAQTVGGVKTFSSTISGSIDGNAATATALATGRDIALTGDATGTASAFTGAANADITVTLANSGVSAGTYTKLTVDAKGRATSGTTLEAADIPSLTAAKVSDFDTAVRTSRLDQMAAPTASVSLNSQKITSLLDPTADTDAANKGYVDSAVSGLVDSAPEALNTLNELAAALNDDADFATTVSTSIGEKLAKASNLSDLADAATARTNLGVAIGSDVQAYDAELAALAGLTSAADKVPYFTGSGTASVADLTSFGRSLVDDADAAAARTTLGLGTIATQAADNVAITGGTISNVTVSDITIDGGTY